MERSKRHPPGTQSHPRTLARGQNQLHRRSVGVNLGGLGKTAGRVGDRSRVQNGTIAVQQVSPNFALNFSTAVSTVARSRKMANVVEPLPDISAAAAPFSRRNS